MSKITLDQFTFTKPNKDDLPKLERIWESCKYIEDWTDDKGDSDETMEDFFLNNTNLPPNGKKENSIIYTITSKEQDKIIGYIQYYLGFPDEQTIWLTTLIIGKEFQGNNYGKTVFDIFLSEFKKMKGFDKLRLVVALKNWPALRFWTKNGFSKIVNINGDKIIGVDAYANIILEQSL